MKKIIILTAGYGEGHNTAARNLCEALLATGEAEAEVIDLMALTHRRINALLRQAYLATIRHLPALWEKFYRQLDTRSNLTDSLRFLHPMRQVLERLIAEKQPWAIVSTYPVYNYLIDALYPDPTTRPFSQLTVVTDSITINAIWYRCGSDLFLVPNEPTARVMAERTPVPIRVLGFPVAIRFSGEGAAKQPPGPGEPWRVLYVVNAWKERAPELVEALLERPEIDLTVVTGRDTALYRRLERMIKGRRCTLLGWTRQMPELLDAAHFYIGKAGGASVQEALAACTPMLVTQVIPGQEEGNARLITEAECGTLAESLGTVLSVLTAATAHGGALWQQWHRAMVGLSRPSAAREIAQVVLETEPPALSRSPREGEGR